MFVETHFRGVVYKSQLFWKLVSHDINAGLRVTNACAVLCVENKNDTYIYIRHRAILWKNYA